MLDNKTKKKIDNCRDILVGKIPDPKAQVGQITIALMYKFMDDMDKEAVEIGGKPTFFVDEYEQYSWTKLMSPKLGGQEKVNLYAEAITKMPQNPHIPQLFRDIFKGAYLPYRAPETIRMFLKEINEFTYDHSERLGDAYEYLLSIMSSQGDAGMFRTPRNIIDFIVKVVDPKKDESVLDPACGTAGFLIAGYTHILKNNKDKLTPSEKEKLMNNFVGYDISPDMVKMAEVNMYLHKFPNPKIYEYDTLSSQKKWDETFDVIMANPPFMTPKGGIIPHNRFTIKSKRAEALFVDYIKEHLNIDGRAGVIVPEGIIFKNENAIKSLRKNLIEENYLYAVVSLPAGVFQPYAGVKTSILLMDKKLAKKTDKILFVKVENDGYDLGATRKPIDKNDIPGGIEVFKKYRQDILSGSEPKIEDKYAKLAHIVKKEKIAEDKQYNLSGSRYKKIEIYDGDWPYCNLEELEKQEKIEFLRGRGLTKKNIVEDGKYKCIHYGEIYTFYDPIIHQVISKTDFNGKITSKKGDVLVPATTTADAMGIAVARSLNEEGVVLGGDINIIRTRNKYILSDYLALLISTPPLKITLSKFAKGANILHLSNRDLKKLKAPLPPVEVQKEIVTEIENYQKIIDGARQVVENYKPHIDVDPEWPILELGKLSSFKRGPFGGSLKKEIFVKDGYCVYEQGHAIKDNFEDVRYFIDKNKFKEMQQFEIKPGDLIMSCSGTIGKIAIVPDNVEPGIINQALLKLTPSAKINVKYLKYIMESNKFQKSLEEHARGAGIKNVASVKILKTIGVPVPDMNIQKRVVAKIEEEQKIIKQNKKLIKMYEKKIKDRVTKIWESN